MALAIAASTAAGFLLALLKRKPRA